ncbi:MAG TPA: A24 family peptidase [Candidatus Norongarragalinales archaeon]|jgi:Flp pilus assembly protein protease CpaA|nr:A24 family peptidase [Candidatus Norongarragalinales archaeon]
MNLEIIRLIVAIGGTAIAAYQDGKTSFIDEKLLYGMAGVGFLLNLLTFDWSFISWSVGLAIVILAAGYFAYKSGQFGGGDVWLFAGIALLLPYYPQELGQWLQVFWMNTSPTIASAHLFASSLSQYGYPLVLGIFVSSAAIALMGSTVQYGIKMKEMRVKLKPDYPSLAVALVIGLVALFVFNFLQKTNAIQSLVLLAIVVPAVFLSAFKRQIMEEIIIQKVPLKEFEDEDVIVTDLIPKRIVEKFKIERVATKEVMKRLREVEKKEGMHKFPVCKGLPRFGPYVLVALVLTLLFGDLLAFVIALG